MTKHNTPVQAPLDDKTHERHAWWREYVSSAVTFAVLLGVMLFWAWSMSDRARTVVSAEPAGEVVNAEFISGTMIDKTKVETSKGVYLVHGTFQATKGNTLFIELRKNGDRLLCDRAASVCLKFAD